MRPIACIAATAVGLITPVAFAVPALAQPNDTDSENINITAETTDETGEVSFSIEGSNLSPSTPVEITSSDVDDACQSNELDGLTETTDEDGNLSLTAAANNCDPGTYTVEITQLDDSGETFTESVTID